MRFTFKPFNEGIVVSSNVQGSEFASQSAYIVIFILTAIIIIFIIAAGMVLLRRWRKSRAAMPETEINSSKCVQNHSDLKNTSRNSEYDYVDLEKFDERVIISSPQTRIMATKSESEYDDAESYSNVRKRELYSNDAPAYDDAESYSSARKRVYLEIVPEYDTPADCDIYVNVP